MTLPDRSLTIAARHYHWKPAKALFHALELEQYARSGVRFPHPVLDLGCSDGIFASMLRDLGVVDFVDVAFDYSRRNLGRSARGVARCFGQADARALPLKNGSLASILANGVLCSVTSDVERAIAEIHRVLADHGLLVVSLPTSGVNETQLLPRLLREVGAGRLSRRYLEKLNHRLDLYQLLDEDEWLRKIESAPFRVEQVHRYFTPTQAFWTDFLTLQPFRVFALSRVIPLRPVERWITRALERGFRGLIAEERRPPGTRDRGGYILIVARKASA